MDLDYLVSVYNPNQDENDAIKLAERDYLDNFSQKSGTVTILPKFTSSLEYNKEDEDIDNSSTGYKSEAAKPFDGLAIYFSFTEMEFKGSDLYKLGLIK